MKDNKQLFGYAAIIMAIGFLVRSFMPAYAFNGPTVSMGSNPIKNFYGVNRITAGSRVTIFSNTSSSDFIITQTRQNKAIQKQTQALHWTNTVNYWACQQRQRHRKSNVLFERKPLNTIQTNITIFHPNSKRLPTI